MLYLWKMHGPEDASSVIGVYDSDLNFDRFQLLAGERVSEEFPKPLIRFEEKCSGILKFDCLANTAAVPLIRRPFYEDLESMCGSNIQYIPARIEGDDGGLEDYGFLNVLNRFQIIDRSKSKFTCLAGTEKILKYKKCVYKEERMNGYHLVRDDDYATNLLVSESLKHLLSKKSYSNVWLIPV